MQIITPRYYQAEAVRALIRDLYERSLALLDMGSGLGKTYAAAFLIQQLVQDLGRMRVLWLCHDNKILEGAMEKVQRVLGDSFTYGFFHGWEKELNPVDVLFASFQTMKAWKDAHLENEFDLIIVDEAHHAYAETYKETLDYFTPGLSLGMTGTVERMDGLDIGDIWGDPSYIFPMERGIREGILSQLTYHVRSLDINRSKLQGMVDAVKEGKTVFRKMLNELLFIRKLDSDMASDIKQFQDNRQTIVFCESIEHAERMALHFPNSRTYHSGNGKYAASHRKTLDDFYRARFQTLLVRDRASEGVDTVNVELLVFARCTDSRRIFLQQLARGLRKSERSLIVLDYVANVERILMIKDLLDRVKPEKGAGVPRDPHFISGDNYSFIFQDEIADILEVLKKLKVYISDIPHLLEEYDTSVNKLPPNMVLAGTNSRVAWVCSTCGWRWKARGQDRLRGNGCAACKGKVATPWNNLTVTHPELAAEFHPTKNKIKPDEITAGSGKVIVWLCSKCGWTWPAICVSRKKGGGCPACLNRAVTPWNNLAVTNPELLSEYHPTKNKLKPHEIVAGTGRKIHWLCPKCGWEWAIKGCDRLKSDGCPACNNHVATPWNNLTVTHPELAREYHPTRNAEPPDKILAGGDRKIWWICAKCSHVWPTKVCHRKGGSGCPACDGKIASRTNNLAVVYPELAKEYHPTLNPLPADKVLPGGNREYWWRCPKCHHEWPNSVRNRNRWPGCPKCKKGGE